MYVYKLTVPPIAEKKIYLWIPVCLTGELKRLRIRTEDGTIWQEMQLRPGKADWYAPLDVSAYAGSSLFFDTDAPADWFGNFQFSSHPPKREHCSRPQLHFTTDRGWNNDPNGLIFRDGVWHMFFQYNPYDVEWNNMQWGHAVSRDLIRWQQLDTALFPDETGTMYSGSAVTDRKGSLGFGKGTLAFFYTAAGDKNDWSAGVPFTQRIAVLRPDVAAPELDCAMEKTGITAVGHIAGENRDPKVFWHEASSSYIMVLYLDGHDFAVFRSPDLRKWTLSQQLTLEESWECPDLFCLPVEGSGETRWVFWAADGYYFIGDFDGYRFTPESGRLCAYAETGSRIPYAAQTFSGTEGRVISVAWFRLPNRNKPYTGMMSIPAEFSLVQTENGLRLRAPYVKELEAFRRELGHFTDFSQPIPLPEDGAWLLDISAGGDLELELPFGAVSLKDGNLTVLGSSFALPKENNRRFTLLADLEVLELHAANDTICAVWEIPPQKGGNIRLHPETAGSAEAILSVFDTNR